MGLHCELALLKCPNPEREKKRCACSGRAPSFSHCLQVDPRVVGVVAICKLGPQFPLAREDLPRGYIARHASPAWRG